MTSTYTVAFTNAQTGNFEVSRYFDTKKAAIKWAKWLRTTKFVAETLVYEGPAGGNLIQREAA
jgi:hypothetical protein